MAKAHAAVPVEGAPLELAVEDPLPSVAAKPLKKHSSTIATIPQGNMDGAMGIVRTRLASEEQFNLRLRQLLNQSGLENHKKQKKMVALQLRLRTALQQQKRLRGASVKKEAEIARQRSRAETAENRLRTARQTIGVGERSVKWLSQRVKTLLSHLSNVTHIGEVLERRLTEANANAASKGVALASIARKVERVPFAYEKKLHEVQSSKSADEANLKAVQRRNSILEESLESMHKR